MLADGETSRGLWGAEMRSVMKHAHKCGAIRQVLVLRRRFVAFPEARLQLALKRKALAGQCNDVDDDDYNMSHKTSGHDADGPRQAR
jgi:hypothetical protein